MEEFFRQNLASLSGSEAKLLLSLFRFGTMPNSELMRLSGVRDRKTFYDALHHLRETGWMDLVGKYNINSWDIQLPQLGNPTIYHYPPLPQLDNPTKELEKPTEVVGKSNQDSREIQPMDMEGATDRDFERALELADEMDGDGDERNPKSAFQARRKQQMHLLQDAWADMFGQELHPLGAKELLQAAHSQALDVYYAMQKAAEKGVEHPKGYVRKILENTKPKQVEEEGPLAVTAQDRARWAENEKLTAGWLSEWEE